MRRFDIKVTDLYQGYEIVTIHHDRGTSVMLGRLRNPGRIGATYVVGSISSKSAEYDEWYNGYYSDDFEIAGKEYATRVAARIAA